MLKNVSVQFSVENAMLKLDQKPKNMGKEQKNNLIKVAQYLDVMV
jgi:hypothetical protein